VKKPAATNKQELFLRAYANTGVISSAAKFAKVARSSHYEWLHDPKYAEAFEQAHQEAIEALELELRKRAKRSDILLMFLLKRHRPEYRESHRVEQTGYGGTPLEVVITFVSADKPYSALGSSGCMQNLNSTPDKLAVAPLRALSAPAHNLHG
jgi:hypothetical protein